MLSTVHASSAFGIIPRLVSDEIGMPLAAVTSPNFLTAMVYQKLIPVLCEHCKLPAIGNLDTAALDVIAALGIDVTNVRVEGAGCERCKGRGTAGQTVVAEVCELTDDMLDLLRESHFWEAERQWRASHNGDLTSPDMTGKTAIEHAIYKMSQGRIDPRDIEASFYKLKKYHLPQATAPTATTPRRLASV